MEIAGDIAYTPHKRHCGLTVRDWCILATIGVLTVSLISVTALFAHQQGVDLGGWGEWEDFGDCSKECGGGQKEQRRKCWIVGGICSTGPSSRTVGCNNYTCPGLF